MGSLTSGVGGILTGGTAMNKLTGGMLNQGVDMFNTAMGGGLGEGLIRDAATKQQAEEQYANAQKGLGYQDAFLQALQAQNGIQNQSNVYNQLAGVASGTGPNPAQAMLNQATSNNIANQAALMAGQRGASSNPALIARMAAQQGGNLQQQAVGQGATMQANQSLDALNRMGALAGQQVSQQANATTGYNQMAQNEQAQILGAIANQNNAQAGINKARQEAAAKMIGNITGAAGAVVGMAHGGQVESKPTADNAAGPKSHAAKFLKEMFNQPPIKMAEGGEVPVKLSPGEVYLPPETAQNVVKGKADPIEDGKKVPGKAKVKGDSLENDTFNTHLEEGGIVIPRSVINSKDPHKAAADFVAAHLSRLRK